MGRYRHKVLVACEESQAVTKAFRENGIMAVSCDIQECSGGHPNWHIMGDVLEVINDGWDAIIAHPPCTYLANSGVSWLHKDASRWGKLDEGASLFRAILEADVPFIAVENPIPHKYAVQRIGRKYDQLIQPWMFGHPESKATCLWLKGFPPLVPTKDVKAEWQSLPKSKAQRLHWLPPSADRAKLRSKTFPGIAKAMADQWGKFLDNH